MRAPLVPLAFLAFAACEQAPERRVWRPEDHEPPRERSGQVAAGSEDLSVQVLYARLCVTCHGPDGRGSSMPGIRAPDLTATKRTDDEMVQSILRGRGRMPPFRDQVTEADARDLVRMIRGM